MSILSTAKPPTQEPLVVTICGTPGTGKTSVACTFPGPAFLIQTMGEQVPRDLPRDQMPVSLGETSGAKALWDQLTALVTEEHKYRTVIIDSVTGLEQLFIDEVIRLDPKAKGIQQALGGYGAGRDAVAVMHGRVRKAAELMRRKGIHVVFIAHSDVERMDPPDSDSYTRYSLRLHAKSMSPYTDSVDIVGFLRQSVITRGEDGGQKKAITTGERVLVTHLTPIAITKNRVGIEDDLPVKRGENPLQPWIDNAPRRSTRPKPKPNEANEVKQVETM